MSENLVYYFAYASNMSSKRLRQSCPEAKLKGIGKLEHNQFVFMGYKEEWAGAVANAVPKQGECIWGVIWELKSEDLKKLGGTESKSGDQYEHVTEVCDIIIDQSELLTCTYFRRDSPNCQVGPPSPQYLQLILEGAIEHQLNDEYVDKLRRTVTNGNTVLTEGMRLALQ